MESLLFRRRCEVRGALCERLLKYQRAAGRGISAIARLADDWPEQRQTCADLRCAYLRMPYGADPHAELYQAGEKGGQEHDSSCTPRPSTGGRQSHQLCRLSLDFTGAVFDGGSLGGANLREGLSRSGKPSFASGRFSFNGVSFGNRSRVNFDRSRYTGAYVSFIAAQFEDGVVIFNDGEFDGGKVSFEAAKIVGGQVSLRDAQISGGDLSMASGQPSDSEGGLADLVLSLFPAVLTL